MQATTIPWDDTHHSYRRRVRRATLGGLTRSGVSALCRPLTRDSAVIFMLHRLAEPDEGVTGFDPGILRSILDALRRAQYEFIDLRSALSRLRGQGRPLRKAVVFTIDDGYREHATVAAPVFAEFDCPVTTFVTTGFLDRLLWFWWDQIAYIFSTTHRRTLQVDLPGGRRLYAREPAGWQHAQEDFIAACKALAEPTKHDAIRCLAAAAEVDLPEVAPFGCAPMTWDELRAAERLGMTFGPHTVTHPILARTTDDQSRWEIRASWDRLREEATAPVPLFAYPNGQPGDFSEREIRTVREIGLEGACTGFPAYATRRSVQHLDGVFRVPRFALPDDFAYVELLVSGLERLRQLIRRES